MLQAIKVKVKTLAAEAVFIRKEERKALASARWQRLNRVNDCTAYNPYHSLREHRTQVVRTASRSTQLAYAFLRGKAYRDVERVGSSTPSWKDVLGNVRRFNPSIDPKAFEEWRDAA